MIIDTSELRKPYNMDHYDTPGYLGDIPEAGLKKLREAREGKFDIESQVRDFDWLTSQPGTMEDLIGERRALMDFDTMEERDAYRKHIEDTIEEHRVDELELGNDTLTKVSYDPALAEMESEHPYDDIGPWSECLIRVDRVQKVQKGGTMLRYRALIIGGNFKGCIGFGVGKANGPEEATQLASRNCKRNVIFVEPYQGVGLTSDLVGKHNSCKVFLRATGVNRPLKGNPLVKEILSRAGITSCTAKSHGSRNVYSVVRATFKALMTHESLEDISLKRGRRFLNLDRAKRYQIM
eukprot:CAMPEP_0116021320 /NCGR_PEP_ID=MMETSP0321-20121206/10321_1 /TAXON_ID=163516 /ORGANISM="Leptocylindrus danicus var. danicus, Strain B650" /LENGTH=293 /DNA_ID=CAMNT_0003492177 /DNA_START=208 /DNA_END=1089 /DNA_ORIENTATION=-